MRFSFKIFLWTFLYTFLLPALPVFADSPDYHDSPTDDCVEKLGNNPTADAIIACFETPTKRSNFRPAHAESVKVARQADALSLGQVICTDSSLPKKFYPTDQVQAMAAEVCQKMYDGLFNNGAGIFTDTYSNGTYKSGDEFHGGGNIRIRALLSLSPPAFRNLGNGVLDIVQFCEKAMRQMAQEGVGCTQPISGYNAGKARTDHIIGAESGWFPVNVQGTLGGVFALSFLKP